MKTGKGYSTAQAIEILAQCALLRAAIDKLTEKAMKSLTRPELRVIDGGVNNDSAKGESKVEDGGEIPPASTNE